jgi:hypothetical protein
MRTEKETQFRIALPLLWWQHNQVEVISLIRSPLDESGKRKNIPFFNKKSFFLWFCFDCVLHVVNTKKSIK